MISERTVKAYCNEDPSLIENYYKAINDETQIWDCHHRLEIYENKTIEQLKAEGRYLNRPASELIFLTHAEHVRLHMEGEKHPMYGHSCTEYMTAEQIEKWRANKSKAVAGEKNPIYGKERSKETKRKLSKAQKEWLKTHTHGLKEKRCITNGIINQFIYPSEFHIYEKQGYRWGKTSNKNKIK